MAPKHVFVLLISILAACLWANVAVSRDLDIKPGYEVLVGNFEIGRDQAHCFSLLREMRSCTKVRETNLATAGCCLAISAVANHCSPTTLSLVGFKPEVYTPLRAHCNSKSSSPAPAPATAIAIAPSTATAIAPSTDTAPAPAPSGACSPLAK